MEFDYLLVHMLNRDPSKNELNFYKLGMPGNMETRMIREYPIEFYLKELEKVRTILNENLKELNDEWLQLLIKFPYQTAKTNEYYLRHLIHDELCHQGQMKMILKRMRYKNIE
tara:strand:- start:204 stop:542 length:339 start_codon:yes stop_codon:yes gene_type:complete